MYAPNHWSGMANRRWAMTIDLARCTGARRASRRATPRTTSRPSARRGRTRPCTPCPKPGFNITRGREMNWLRIERYFEGADDGAVHGGLRDAARPDALPALRQRALRAGVSRAHDVSRAGRSQRPGLQPVRRHALLQQQLPVQGPLLQLVRIRRGRPQAVRVPRAAELAAQSGRHGARRRASWRSARSASSASAKRRRERGRKDVHWSRTSSRRRARKRVPRARSSSATRRDPTWTVAQQVEDRRAYVFEELNTFTAVVYLKKVNHPGPATPARSWGARRWQP